MFRVGEQANVKLEVTIFGIEKKGDKWFYRVRLLGFPWSFVIPEEQLEKINICAQTPFPKCNNGEGCDTCEYNGEKNVHSN